MRTIIAILLLLLPFTTNAAIKIQYGAGDYNNNITCTKPSVSQTQRFKNEFKLFLKTYKGPVIAANLNKVVVCKKLTRGSFDWYRGTYVLSQRTIYVEVDGADDTEYLLHHEFSSLLLLKSNKKSQLKDKWSVWSKQNYNIEHKKRGWATKNNLQKDGFLYEYNKVSFENDFNVIASFYLCPYLKYKLDKASKKYWRIQKKYNEVRNFYRPLLR